MLELRNVGMSFGYNTVLNNLSCTANPGDFVVIVGTNGAGKTTLFDTISGKLQATAGQIFLDGVDITDRCEQERAPMVARLFQNPSLNSVGSMTVEQNLSIAGLKGKPVRLADGMHGVPRASVQAMLQELPFYTKELAGKTMASLSGGQRQLIAFMMATQQVPKILLLDEPTAALDPHAATMLLAMAYEFTRMHDIITLLITHDPQVALSMASKIWVLEKGRISKEFGKHDAATVRPQDLIGHIDYDALSAVAR